jgi:chemotaxis protein histidine kinase CheA
VLIDHERQPKIINAGLINIFFNTDNEDISNSLQTHLSFSAPEILDNPKNISEKSDVYTCALFIKYVFGNGDLFDDHHDLSDTPIYLHNIISKGLSENPDKRHKNVSDFSNDFITAVCSNTQISGSYIPQSEIQAENSVSETIVRGMPEIDDVKTNEIDFNIEEETQNIDIPKEPSPVVEKVPESDIKANDTSKSMNYYEVLAALEAEKKAQANAELQKKSTPVTEQQVRSSSYVPKADPESKSAKFTAKKEENRVQQQQSQSYNKPPQQESNTNYQTRSQQQSQSYNQPPQQSSNINYQTRSQQQNTYSQHQPPSVSVNTAGIVVLGFLGIIFSFTLPLVGFILAIIGLSQLPKQKQKLIAIKRDFSQSEKTNRTIGTIFSIIALLVSIIRMLIFVVNLVS